MPPTLPRAAPDGSGKLSGSPLAASDTDSLRSFPVPSSSAGNSSVRNFELPRTAGAVTSPGGPGAPAPPRCLSGVTEPFACPGSGGSSSPTNSARAPSPAAPASGAINSRDGSARWPRWAVNREVGGTLANSKFNFRKNSSWSQTQQPTGRPGSRLKYVNLFFFFLKKKRSGKQAISLQVNRELRDASPEGPEFRVPGRGAPARPPAAAAARLGSSRVGPN